MYFKNLFYFKNSHENSQGVSLHLLKSKSPPSSPSTNSKENKKFDFAQKFVRDKVISQVCTKKF